MTQNGIKEANNQTKEAKNQKRKPQTLLEQNSYKFA